MAEEPLRFEQILERLRTIVENLERGDLSLEDSLAQFEEGVRLSRGGATVLDDAERKIEVLLKNPDGTDRIAPFAPSPSPSPPAGTPKDDDIPF